MGFSQTFKLHVQRHQIQDKHSKITRLAYAGIELATRYSLRFERGELLG